MNNLTLEQVQNGLLFIVAFGGAVWTIIQAIKKIIVSALKESLKPMQEKLDDLEDSIKTLEQNDKQNADMIYQMLDHMATNNNSGGMKQALNEYNAYYRHG